MPLYVCQTEPGDRDRWQYDLGPIALMLLRFDLNLATLPARRANVDYGFVAGDGSEKRLRNSEPIRDERTVITKNQVEAITP